MQVMFNSAVMYAEKFSLDKWLKEIAGDTPHYPMVKLSITKGFKPVIETDRGELSVVDGDYIVTLIDGTYFLCNDETFKYTFSVMEGENEDVK